jgi:hypothetical protein
MTISSNPGFNDYDCNGVTTAFPFTFKVFAEGDLRVFLRNTDTGAKTDLVLNTHYTVSGAGNGAGGTVTTLTTYDTPYTLHIRDNQTVEQQTDLRNQTRYSADTVESELDRLAMIQREQQKVLDRCIKVADGDTSGASVEMEYPDGGLENKVLAFDANSNATPSATVAEGILVSAAMEPVVGAATLSAARLAIGISAAMDPVVTAETLVDAREELGPFTTEIHVRDRGAIGDGVADDTAAVQAAIDELSATGGTLLMDGARCRITSQITVSSLYPVNIKGDCKSNSVRSKLSGFCIGANLGSNSMVKYQSPTGDRAACGGGTVDGVGFWDATGRTYPCFAALYLYDFSISSVQNCVFDSIKGSAITGEYLVMSSIANNIIRYSGDTSKPAAYIPSTSATYKAQSLEINANCIEVCQGAAYLSLGANATDVPASSEIFLVLPANCNSNIISNNVFNRNAGIQVSIAGAYNVLSGNTFKGGAYNTDALLVSGNLNSVCGNSFVSNRTGLEVHLSGAGNIFSGNTLYYAGGIKCDGGAGNVISGNHISYLSCTLTDLGTGNGYWINSRSSSGSESITGNMLENTAGPVTDVGGINLLSPNISCTGNAIKGFAGSGNGLIGIRVADDDAVVTGNNLSAATILLEAGYTSPLIDNNRSLGRAMPFIASATYDPPNLADGAGVTTTVTCAGAVLSDLTQASFTNDLQGITMTSWVSSANTVSVRFQNESGGVLDLASGTLIVKVCKR